MNTNQITNETPLAFLTVGQFLELIKSEINCQTVIVPEKTKHLVYGIRGIRELLGVSNVTAFKYKETILKEAVSQYGRKIIVDADLALELFKNKKTNFIGVNTPPETKHTAGKGG